MSLFDRPIGDWSDAELDAGVRVVAVRHSELAAAGDAALADTLNGILCALVDERSRRAVLYRDMRWALADATPDSLAALDAEGWLPDDDGAAA